jgi:hypothetical protein
MKEARTLERPAGSGPREHEVGAHGVVTVSTTLDAITVRGVDGTTARLVGPDTADILTEALPGRLSVRTATAPDWPATGTGHGWLGNVLSFGFVRGTRTIELEVPRGCRVEASTASGTVTLTGIDGGIAVNSASGDVIAEGITGDARIRTASGRVSLAGPDRLTATVRTASGDVRLVAGRLADLQLSTVSGRAEISGTIEPTFDGVVSTASGRVVLALDGDVTVAVRTVSGRTRASHAAAAPGDRVPGWVLGAGTARLAVSTISGGIDLREPLPAGEEPRSTAAGVPGEGSGAEAESGGAPAAASSGMAPADEAAPAAAPPADGLAATKPVAAASPAVPDAATLDILRALERGEIDVDEAARRLDGRRGDHSDA